MLTTSENSNPKISCIYINYRSAQFLERSLRGLFQNERSVPFEVIVVNNDKGEKELIEALQKKYPIRIFEAFHNPGFGASANAGAREAKGEILFFINPDTQWQKPLFQEITRVFENNSALGALGLQLISPKGEPETKSAGNFFVFPKFFSHPRREEKVEWVSGGALFVPINIFQELKGFDERFFMYFEDMDFCLRLQQKGYRIVLSPDQQLIHLGGKSHVTKKTQKAIYDRSLYEYTKKHWSSFQYLLFRFMHPCYRFFFPYGRS